MDIGSKGTVSSWESDASAPFISKRGLIIIWLFVGMKLFQSSSNVKTQRRYNITVYNIHKQNNRTHTLLFSSHAHASSHTPAFYHFTSHITRTSLPPSPVLCCLASCYFYETFLHSFCLRCTFVFVAHHYSWIGKNVWKAEAYSEANMLTCFGQNYKARGENKHTEECHYCAQTCSSSLISSKILVNTYQLHVQRHCTDWPAYADKHTGLKRTFP